MKRQLHKLLNQTIYVAEVASYDGPNEVLSTPRAVRAYVEIKRDVVGLGVSGSELNAPTVVVTEDEIQVDWRVWLPGADQTNESFSRKPRSVNPFFDVDGSVHHYETTL